MRPAMKVFFFRRGVELTGHAYHGADLIDCGRPAGIAGKLFCFESIDVSRGPHDSTTLSPTSFGGPVTVKVWCPDHEPQLFGLATERDIARLRLADRSPVRQDRPARCRRAVTVGR